MIPLYIVDMVMHVLINNNMFFENSRYMSDAFEAFLIIVSIRRVYVKDSPNGTYK
jgi:hypothetical protein